MEDLWIKFKHSLMKLAYFQKRSRVKRYVMPLLLAIIIFPIVSFLLSPYSQLINSQTVSLLVFIVIVTISAWYGGLGPGLLTTFLTAFMSYIILLGEDISIHPRAGDAVAVFIYIIVGIFISVISEARYEADVQKDEFVGFVSHELKTPLTVIIGFSGLLHRYSNKLKDEKIFLYTNEIRSQSTKLLELINDLLDITKIEVGKFVYKDELFDFVSLVKEVIRHQKIINNQREIRLTGKTYKPSIMVEGDRYRIKQVIINLLINAIKYSPQKSHIDIKIKSSKEKVVLSVKDYGIGILQKEQKAIFSQYYRTKKSIYGKAQGLGLGLFIASQIMLHHQGKLWVKSNGVKGSIFFLELPRAVNRIRNGRIKG